MAVFDASTPFDNSTLTFDGAVAPQSGFPTITVNLGFNINPTTNYLILDDLSKGKLDTGILASTAGISTDVSAYALDITTSRGRNRLLQAYKTGNCSVVFDNTDGRFDPNNLSGPYVSGGVTLLTPETLLWITATWLGVTYPIFYGTIDSFAPSWPAPTGRGSRCTVVASDGFKILNRYTPQAPSVAVGAGETTDVRIGRLLDLAQWPSSARNLGTGLSTLQPTTLATNVLQEIQASVDSEYGSVYMGAEGNVTFENRNARMANARSNSVQATFDDQGYYLPYESLTPVFDVALLRNQVQTQNVGGLAQSASDGASQTKFYTQTLTNNSLLLQNDLDALHWAQWALYLNKDYETRIEKLELNGVSSDSLWPHMLGRLLSDRIRVLFHPPISQTLDVQLFIEGIDHKIGLGAGSPSSWLTSWSTSMASKYTLGFVLDSATLGVLDQNVLAGF